jgi:hypothetical protein
LLVAAAALSVEAQDRKKLSADEQSLYVVSAKAGVVNIIEGEASIKEKNGQWNRAIAGEDLPGGATIKTGDTGRVEILLNPGCFLRLDQSSELVYVNGNTYGLKLHLLSGSAIVEAAALDGPIKFKAGETEFVIAKDGLYRFTKTGDGKDVAIVRQGKAMLGKTEIKGSRKATVAAGAPLVAKLDKKVQDEFDLWSKERARTLIAANKRLSEKAMRKTGLLTSMVSVWIYDTSCGCRTWLPGGYGFSSPYGWSYSRCNPYWPGYNWGYRNRGGYYSGGGNSGGGNYGGGQPGGRPGGGGGVPKNSPPINPRIDPPNRGSMPSGGAERGREIPVQRRPNGN